MASTIDLDLNPDKEYEIVAGQPEEKTMGGARHGGVGVRLCGTPADGGGIRRDLADSS